MNNKTFDTILLCATMFIGVGIDLANAQESEDESIKHHHLTLTIGHSHIPSGTHIDGEQKMILIPTWGFSYEFLFTEHVGLGLKNDIEVSNYIITNEEGSEVERENPFSSSIVFLYNPIKGLGFFIGPGVELEKEENYFIFTVGISYEVELPGDWDIAPELGYESKGGHTGAISFGLSIGKKFGKKTVKN
jgi:hypothetical protein